MHLEVGNVGIISPLSLSSVTVLLQYRPRLSTELSMKLHIDELESLNFERGAEMLRERPPR